MPQVIKTCMDPAALPKRINLKSLDPEAKAGIPPFCDKGGRRFREPKTSTRREESASGGRSRKTFSPENVSAFGFRG